MNAVEEAKEPRTKVSQALFLVLCGNFSLSYDSGLFLFAFGWDGTGVNEGFEDSISFVGGKRERDQNNMPRSRPLSSDARPLRHKTDAPRQRVG